MGTGSVCPTTCHHQWHTAVVDSCMMGCKGNLARLNKGGRSNPTLAEVMTPLA